MLWNHVLFFIKLMAAHAINFEYNQLRRVALVKPSIPEKSFFAFRDFQVIPL